MGPVTVRLFQGTAAEINAICRLNQESLGYQECTRETVASNMQQLLERGGNDILVATCEEGVIGYLHMADYIVTCMPRCKIILAMAVDNRYQGMGVGRQLISHGETMAAADKAYAVLLYSGADREMAHQFYQGMGYSHRKDHKNYIKYL